MYFVRCILPNNDKKGDIFEEEMVLRQLLTSSTISYGKFIRFGYSNHVPYQKIFEACKSVERLRKHCVDRSDFCLKILLSMGFKLNDFKMGCNAIAFRANKIHMLEELLSGWPVVEDRTGQK